MPGGLADDLPRLSLLSSLELHCAESPLPPLEALTALVNLR